MSEVPVTTEQVHELIQQLAAMNVAASITPQIVANIFEKMRNLNDQEREKVIAVAEACIQQIEDHGELSSNEENFIVSDKHGYVVCRMDSEGLTVVRIKVKKDGELVDILDLLHNKVDKIAGKGLSSNDFTNSYKNKIDNIGEEFSSEDKTLYITDKNNNIAGKLDKDGLSVIGLQVKYNGVLTDLMTILAAKADKDFTDIESETDTLYVTDEAGYIGFKVDEEGVHAPAFIGEGGGGGGGSTDVEIVYVDVYSNQGVTAIQSAIAAITDSSATKQYVVRLHGEFTATQDSDFSSFNSVMDEKSVIAVKASQSYITIQGDGIDKTIVHGALPDNLGSSYAYNLRTLATINGDHITIKDLTLSHDNGRYVVHTYGAPANAVHTFDNIRLICPKNTGDALSVWTSKCPYGAGFQNGNYVEFKNGIIESESSMFLCHDNTGMTIPFTLRFDSVKFIKKGVDKVLGNLSFIGSNCKSVIELNNIIGGYGAINLACKSSSFVDDGCIEVKGNIGDKSHISPIRQASVSDQLRIDVDDTAAAHAITFDTTSSAFSAIIGSNTKAGCVDRFGIRHYGGFIAKEGAIGFKAWCMGLKPVYSSNGLRALGDCSSTNKTLGLVIDGDAYSITLDLDYSSMTNTDILADINTKLATLAIPCTASFYSYGMEFCFSEADNVIEMKNVGASPITCGHIVKRVGYGFDLCTSNADVLGVLLDDVKVGGMGRVMIRGFMGRYLTRYYILPKGFNTDNGRYGCSAQGTLTADANGKFLAVGTGEEANKGHFIIFPA